MEQTYEQEFLDELKQLGFFDKLNELGLTPQRAAQLLSQTELPNSTTDADNLTFKVTTILSDLGFSSHLRGFLYLRKAIIYCLENNSKFYVGEAYSLIAQEFGSTYASVERVIRFSIEKVFNTYDSSMLGTMQAIINLRNGKPTPSAFILYVADRIRNNLL